MKIINNYISRWWLPILTFNIVLFFYVLAMELSNDFLVTVGTVLFYTNLIGCLSAAVYQIVKGEWYFSVPPILVAIFLFCVHTVVAILSPPDYYGVHKEIPTDINFNTPMNRTPSSLQVENDHFIISKSFQPGIYNYHTTYKADEEGDLFIKAYEITENDPLSTEKIRKRSNAHIFDLSNTNHHGEFRIYEGSPGDEYGSRIELWFQPIQGEAYKIYERNYIVEGWQSQS